MKKDPVKILELAQTLYENNQYALSLENYKWCFENAEKENSIWKSAKLGACLEGWYILSEKYPPALNALINKKYEIYEYLQNKYDINKFVEYIKICSYLKVEDEPIKFFELYDKDNEKLAKMSFEFMYDMLIKNKKWALCSKYLLEPLVKYESILEKFDELMRISEEAFKGEYNQVYQNEFIVDIKSLFIILEKGSRIKEMKEIKNRLNKDLKSRGGSISS